MPASLEAFVARNPVTHVTTAMRALFAETAALATFALALVLPIAMTAGLAPVVLWPYRRQQ